MTVMFLESCGSAAMARMQEWKGNEKIKSFHFCLEPFGWNPSLPLGGMSGAWSSLG